MQSALGAPRKRFAYFGIPHIGGTHTVYRSLRAGLQRHGIEVRWLGVGPPATAALADPAWKEDRDHGEAVEVTDGDEAALGRAMTRHVVERGYDGVFVNVLASPLQTNAVRYLPSDVMRIMIVHNVTPGTYAAARAVAPWVHAVAGVSERIRRDLVDRHGLPRDRTVAIPNAVELARFNLSRAPRNGGPLRLLSLGRLEDSSKGVLWLPELMQRLAEADVTLTIAGDGPNREELAGRLAGLHDRVRLVGRVAPEDVPALVAEHDAFLMPSRYEGFGQTLVEAMAAGCVPVASRIAGVTDRIVAHGEDGFLFAVGDMAAAAGFVRELAASPARLAAMAGAARRNVQGRFDLERQAAAYAGLIGRIAADPPQIAAPLPLECWHYPRGLRPGLRTRLPEPVKNFLRVWKERLAS
ncbi:glycosyltransferase family 4 protein [Geminicoccaceae bacterium 1502E]|nr:glycosyltransferase family 4 protein [Geminicoccaceae bacterium 1502E]